MKKLISFFKVTIAGGILFLLPVVVFALVISKAYNVLHRFSGTLAAAFPFTKIGGVGIRAIISIVLLLLICFLAGIVMHGKFMQRIVKWLEDHVLVYVPGYSYIKALSTNRLTKEGTSHWKPASVFIDDNEVICFVIDETENYCSLFLPSAPTPSSGSICVRQKAKVRYLLADVHETIMMIRQFGKGAAREIEKLEASEHMAEKKKPGNELIDR